MNTGSVLGDSDSTEALIHSSEIQPHLICSLSAELTRHRRPRGAQLHLVVCINVQTADHTCSREGVHVGFSTYDNCCKGRGGVRMLDAISPAIELGFLNSCCVFSKCPLFRAEADCAGRGGPISTAGWWTGWGGGSRFFSRLLSCCCSSVDIFLQRYLSAHYVVERWLSAALRPQSQQLLRFSGNQLWGPHRDPQQSSNRFDLNINSTSVPATSPHTHWLYKENWTELVRHRLQKMTYFNFQPNEVNSVFPLHVRHHVGTWRPQ